MITQPILSIVIPCHMADPLLDRALASCLALVAKPEIEVVVSWNSTDNAAFEGYRKKHPFFRWCRPEKPLEMGANWDHSISQAKGKWCLILSYDDQLLPDRLLAFLPHLLVCSDEVGCVFGTCGVEDVYGPEPVLTFPEVLKKPRLWQAGELWWFAPWGTPVRLPSTFFRQDAWASAGGFDNGLPFACDALLWARLFRTWAVLQVPDCWAIYRTHPYSLQSKGHARQDMIRLSKIFCDELRPWALLGKLICKFGFARQEYLIIIQNPDYKETIIGHFLLKDRIMCGCINWMEKTTIGKHTLARITFRLMLFVSRLTGEMRNAHRRSLTAVPTIK